MKPKEHWLAAIERILAAETGNLKELAEIAGEDPATLYIGTSLDGADLRGQDLRGMQFDRLDLNRVQHDDRTWIDVPSSFQADDDHRSADGDNLSEEIYIVTQLSDDSVARFASMQDDAWIHKLKKVVSPERYEILEKHIVRPQADGRIYSVGVQAAGARMKISYEIDTVIDLPDREIAKLAKLRGEMFIAFLKSKMPLTRYQRVQELIDASSNAKK